MRSIKNLLKGGDKRSKGKSELVVETTRKAPSLFKDVYEAIYAEDEVLAMRAIDAVEKIAKKQPEWLMPYKKDLLYHLPHFNTKEHRWHVPLLLSYLSLSMHELEIVYSQLTEWISDNKSGNIAKVNCLQALYDLSVKYPRLKKRVKNLMDKLASDKSPSMQARLKILYHNLNHH